MLGHFRLASVFYLSNTTTQLQINLREMSLISRRTLASSSRVLQTAASTASQNASASASGSGPGSKERETANSIIQNVLAMYSQSASTGAASNPFGGAATSGAPGGMDEGRIMLSNLPSGPSGPRPLFAAGEVGPSLPLHSAYTPYMKKQRCHGRVGGLTVDPPPSHTQRDRAQPPFSPSSPSAPPWPFSIPRQTTRSVRAERH